MCYGLLYDVDGVVGNTEPINARATIRVYEELFGYSGIQPSDFTAGLGRGAERYIEAAAEVHGLTLTAEQVAEAAVLRERTILELIRSEGLPTFPGVLELAHEALGHDAFAVGIASSAKRELVMAILEGVGMPYHQMAVLTGDQVSRKKPDPEIFHLAAEAVGLSPGRCVVVEDAPDGVTASKRAGCRCIAVTNSVPAEKLSHADRVVESLAGESCSSLMALVDAAG